MSDQERPRSNPTDPIPREPAGYFREYRDEAGVLSDALAVVAAQSLPPPSHTTRLNLRVIAGVVK
jgi:hypothetical protein